METKVLILSAPKPYAVFSPPQIMLIIKLIKIGHLASDILKFESVDGRAKKKRRDIRGT